MKANLIEMEGFLRGKCLPGDMLVNETNAQYLVRKFAEAEARCAALAAENAGLKRNLEGTAEFCYSEIPETPATDAFLAEVRAQGVEMVIAYHRERAEALHHVDRNNAIRHSMAALDASDVAAKLRQEAAQ